MQRFFTKKAIAGIIGITGIALIWYGVWRIYPPASYITVGIIFLAVDIIVSWSPGNAEPLARPPLNRR